MRPQAAQRGSSGDGRKAPRGAEHASGTRPAGRRHPAAAPTKSATRAPGGADRRTGRSRGTAKPIGTRPSDPGHDEEPRRRQATKRRRTRKGRGRKKETPWDTSEGKGNRQPAPRRAHAPSRLACGAVSRARTRVKSVPRFHATLDAVPHAMAKIHGPAAANASASSFSSAAAGSAVHAWRDLCDAALFRHAHATPESRSKDACHCRASGLQADRAFWRGGKHSPVDAHAMAEYPFVASSRKEHDRRVRRNRRRLRDPQSGSAGRAVKGVNPESRQSTSSKASVAQQQRQ